MSKLPRILPLIAVAVGGVLAVRAMGVAPGLFEGATAWAQEAAPAAAAPKAAPPVCALSEAQLAEQIGISPAELRIISSLGERRKELDARDADFATMLPLLAAAEQKLDARVQELEAIKTEVQGLLGQVDEKAKAETDRMVAVYSAMRPREAAAVFAGLDDSVLLPVAAAMRPRTLAAILAQMPPAEARALTEKLSARYQAAPLAARAAVAAGPTPAPPPPAAATTPTTAPTAAATPTQAAAAAPRQSTRPSPPPRRTPARPPQSRAETAPTPATDAPPAATPPAATPPTTPAQRPRQSVE